MRFSLNYIIDNKENKCIINDKNDLVKPIFNTYNKRSVPFIFVKNGSDKDVGIIEKEDVSIINIYNKSLFSLNYIIDKSVFYEHIVAQTAESINLSEEKSDLIKIYMFFYCNTLKPFSRELMQIKFINIGLKKKNAEILSGIIYNLRTDILGKENVFDTVKSSDNSLFLSKLGIYNPTNIKQLIEIVSVTANLKFSFDLTIAIEDRIMEGDTKAVLLNEIDETNIFIEDHKTILIGLSNSISDVLNFFYLKNRIIYNFFFENSRNNKFDFISLGTFISHLDSNLLFSLNKFFTQIKVIELIAKGRFTKSELYKFNYANRNSIPLYIQFIK